jgi:hypothetical protein
MNQLNSSSEYLVHLFMAQLSVPAGSQPPKVDPPAHFPQASIMEYQQMAHVLSMAYRSPSEFYSNHPLSIGMISI